MGARKLLATATVLALAGGLGGIIAAAPVQATTGNADGLPEPKVLVNPGVGDYYIGRFYLSRVERSAGLESAVLDIDYTESVQQEFIVGDAQFYQYNKQGKLTSWTASLYPFEYKNGLMHCNLLVPGTTNNVLGRLVEDKPTNPDTPQHPNQETIKAQLTIGHSTYAVTFRQGEDEAPPPVRLPRAVQTASAKGAANNSSSHGAVASTATSGVYASVVRLAGLFG